MSPLSFVTEGSHSLNIVQFAQLSGAVPSNLVFYVPFNSQIVKGQNLSIVCIFITMTNNQKHQLFTNA